MSLPATIPRGSMRFAPAVLVLLAGCEKSSVKLEDSAGSEVSGSVAVTPRDIDFGVIFVGQSADADLSVRNAGSDAVAVTLEVIGPWATDYTLDAYTSAPAPGDVSNHVLHVAPTEWGDHSVSVVVDDAVSGGHIEVAVNTIVQLDADGDGYGSTESGGADCDDAVATTYPGAEETWYDGIDSDCGRDDDFDQDGDGFPLEEDCDDEDPAVYPGAGDAWYDGIDSDCAGNDDFDQDGDGFTVDVDCDDADAAINPHAHDTWYDGIDTNCDGADDFDQDGDGFALDDDCNDEDASIHPGAADTWYDGIDSDCAGNDDYDQDGDGVTVETDCNDTDPTTTGPTDEVLDGADNDCDGNVDNVDITDVQVGVVYGDGASVGLGDKGTFALDADIDGDGAVDLVAASDQSGYGDVWVVPATAYVGAAGLIDTVDSITGSGSRGYEPRYVATPALDSTGDGAAELVVNYSNEGGYDYGITYVWDGAATSGTLNGDSAIVSVSGDSDDDLLLGTAMGDFDGDGVIDFVVGSPLDNSGSSYDTGNIAILDGTDVSRGMDISDGTQIHGTTSYDYLGYHLAAGDVTGDGLADIVAGAPGDDDGGSGAGAIYVFSGTSGSFGSTADSAASSKITGGSGDALGEDPIPVPGDVNGDGQLDVGFASEDEGSVWIVLGSALVSGSSAASASTYILTGTGGDFGSSVVIDSDLDGDGADEVVVGVDGGDLNGSNSGGAYIFRWERGWGAALTSADAIASVFGTTSGDYLGTGLSGGGDVNGDGREDIAIGAVAVDAGASDAGAIYLIPGW